MFTAINIIIIRTFGWCQSEAKRRETDDEINIMRQEVVSVFLWLMHGDDTSCQDRPTRRSDLDLRQSGEAGVGNVTTFLNLLTRRRFQTSYGVAVKPRTSYQLAFGGSLSL